MDIANLWGTNLARNSLRKESDARDLAHMRQNSER